MARAARAAKPAPIDLAASSIEILPLTPARWPDVTALFDEGGDPKTCSCMFWRVRSKDWSFANAAEAREGLPRPRRRGPRPGAGPPRLRRRPAGRLGQRRATRGLPAPHELARPAGDRRSAGLVDRLLRRLAYGPRPGPHDPSPRRRDGLRDRARRAGPRGLSGRRRRWPDPGRRRLHGSPLDVPRGRVRGGPRDRLAAGRPSGA